MAVSLRCLTPPRTSDGIVTESRRRLPGDGPNSTDVGDYGVYDTSTLQENVTAVVDVTFGLE